jgi:hypothetical protein
MGYDVDGKPTYKINHDRAQLEPVIPDSLGEMELKEVCGAKVKGPAKP